eukprot:scaffold8581_cov109-Isochrysis_galbana.AAC.5
MLIRSVQNAVSTPFHTHTRRKKKKRRWHRAWRVVQQAVLTPRTPGCAEMASRDGTHTACHTDKTQGRRWQPAPAARARNDS